MLPIDSISEFLQPYQNCHTVRAYRKTLDKFKVEYRLITDELFFLEHLVPKALNNFLKTLHSEKYAKSTISQSIYILNKYFEWAIEREMLDRKPMRKFDRIRLTFKDFKPAYLPMNFDIESFISRPDQFSFRGNNARFIIFLLAGFGLKRSEIANLKLGDLLISDFDNPKMVIRSNREFRTRRYSIEPEGKKEILEFLERRKTYSRYELTEDDYLLQASNLEKNENPIDGSTIFRTVQRYLITDDEKQINPSSFRLYKVLTSIYTRKYYELDNLFGMSHKEIEKYKVVDAKERIRKESQELIEELVKERLAEG